uniref:Uncharacterized protein n=1 Tax=Heterorhabditis bacteriophora TaxID=37862 RepID=A0A1I7XA13_HETBA
MEIHQRNPQKNTIGQEEREEHVTIRGLLFMHALMPVVKKPIPKVHILKLTLEHTVVRSHIAVHGRAANGNLPEVMN